MRINGSMFDPLRPDRPTTAGSPAAGRPNETAAQANTAVPAKSDSVTISTSGRSLVGRLEADANSTFDPERVAELRTKVLTGAYNTLDVVDQVARRILTRGDL